MGLSWIKRCALSLAVATAGLTAGEAMAACAKGAPEIAFDGGGLGCVVVVKTTEITRTRSLTDGSTTYGPVASSKKAGGLVVVQMQQDARQLSKRTFARWGRSACLAYRDELLAQIEKPAYPFMVVLFLKNAPTRKNYGFVDAQEVYLTKGCRERVSRSKQLRLKV